MSEENKFLDPEENNFNIRVNDGKLQIKAKTTYDSGDNKIFLGSLKIPKNVGIQLSGSMSSYTASVEGESNVIKGDFHFNHVAFNTVSD